MINIDVDERRIGLSIKAILPIDKETLERIKKEREEEEAKAKEEKAGKAETATQPQVSPPAEEEASSPAGFVASKTGKKYYPAGSTAAEKIKDENRVTFATEEEAQKAGYSA